MNRKSYWYPLNLVWFVLASTELKCYHIYLIDDLFNWLLERVNKKLNDINTVLVL